MMKRLEIEGRCIQLSDIHPFWKTLKIKVPDFSVHDHPFHNFQIRHNIDKVLHSFFVDILGQNDERKKVIASEIEKMIHPEFTTLKELVVNEQGKSRHPLPPKNSTKRDLSAWEYIEQTYSKYFKGSKGKGTTPVASVHGCKPSHSSVSICDDDQNSSTIVHDNGRKHGRSSNAPIKEAQNVHSHVIPFIDDLPIHIVPYINNIYNVDGDGNCGYRVVDRWIYGDDHRWPIIRKELGMEIKKRYELFSDALGSVANANKTLTSLSHFSGMAPRSKWMSLFDMGSVITTKYNIVVVSYSIHQFMTFFPLIVDEGKHSPDLVIIIRFLESMKHFIMVCGKSYSLYTLVYDI
ncbi:Bifunctional enzyme NanE/NanK [Bienertia sinuspersici]